MKGKSWFSRIFTLCINFPDTVFNKDAVRLELTPGYRHLNEIEVCVVQEKHGEYINFTHLYDDSKNSTLKQFAATLVSCK